MSCVWQRLGAYVGQLAASVDLEGQHVASALPVLDCEVLCGDVTACAPLRFVAGPLQGCGVIDHERSGVYDG